MGSIAACWGLLGVNLLFGYAIVRLTRIALQTFDYPLHWYHWAVMGVWILFMALGEGYRGFQKGFSPRVAARTAYLKDHPTLLRTLLAPVFCMGYFHARRRRQFATVALTTLIVCLVQIVSLLEQPWRGIVDLGVVIGLIWGIISLLAFSFQAFTRDDYPHSPELPG